LKKRLEKLKKANSFHCPPDTEIRRAVASLREGGVVAIPTETYYGLAADPENEQALKRLFQIKQRPRYKPILLLISHLEQLDLFAASVPEGYQKLIERYWPGPLTLVFPAKAHVSSLLTGGTGTVGIRLTPNACARRIIDTFGKAITATSANPSSFEPARSAQQVREAFGDKISCIVDGGPADEGLGSTVISYTGGSLCIERAGRIYVPGLPDCARR
jgi:L-threonylcarbamoyladenylate synthase